MSTTTSILLTNGKAPTKAWGFELVVNCKECTEKVKDYEFLEFWVKTLVYTIKMKAYGKPMIQHFGKDDLAGYTVLQLIETSNISAHFCDTSLDGYINIFSCKEFDVENAINSIKQLLSPKNIEFLHLIRSA